MQITIPDKKTLQKIILLGLAYLLLVNLFTFILFRFQLTSLKTDSLKEIFFGVWGYGWDGMHYTKIATLGYEYPLMAFFPLYPVMIILVDLVLPLTLAYRMNLLLIFPALITLYMLADKDHKFQSLLVLLAFPSAFFLQANYTEATFIIISALGLIAIIKKKYFWAAIMSAALTSSKAVGASLAIVLFISLLRDYKIKLFTDPKLFLKALFLGLISISGMIVYFSFLAYRYKTPMIYFTAQKEWGREIGESTGLVKRLLPPIYKVADPEYNREIYRRIIDPAVFVLAIYLLIKSYKKININLWLFSLINILIPLSTGSLLSFSRLFLLCYPLILYLATMFRRPAYLYSFVVVTALLQGLAIYLFFNTMFVG